MTLPSNRSIMEDLPVYQAVPIQAHLWSMESSPASMIQCKHQSSELSLTQLNSSWHTSYSTNKILCARHEDRWDYKETQRPWPNLNSKKREKSLLLGPAGTKSLNLCHLWLWALVFSSERGHKLRPETTLKHLVMMRWVLRVFNFPPWLIHTFNPVSGKPQPK